jgi:serine/threonine protein kinase
MVMRKVGKYEVGRTIGEGTFAKVKFAQNTETGESVAMKVLDKETVLKHKMVDQVLFVFLFGIFPLSLSLISDSGV